MRLRSTVGQLLITPSAHWNDIKNGGHIGCQERLTSRYAATFRSSDAARQRSRDRTVICTDLMARTQCIKHESTYRSLPNFLHQAISDQSGSNLISRSVGQQATLPSHPSFLHVTLASERCHTFFHGSDGGIRSEGFHHWSQKPQPSHFPLSCRPTFGLS